MNTHQRCLQAKVKHWNETKQVMPKSQDLRKSFNRNKKLPWTLVTEFPTNINETCTYNVITFKCEIKHRQVSYGYHRDRHVHQELVTTHDKH